MRRLAPLLALLALAVPASASAHATLLRTTPENGAVLQRAPAAVRIEFDDTVRVSSGNAVVENLTGRSVLDGEAAARNRVLTLPLRRSLADGDYSVRWSIVSDDGHREQGVLAFAVGAGRASPHPVLGAAATLTWNDVVFRTLYYLGILAGGGAAVFGLATRRILPPTARRPLAHLLFFALLACFLGGSGILHAAAPGTRYETVLKAALTVALAGGAAAALAPTLPALLTVAGAAALALVAAPTLGGHALDRSQPTVLAPLVDVAHMASAAIWFGGLLALAFVVPRAAGDDATRLRAARRFSAIALASVAVLAATGLGRALTELSAVHQAWSTSYGRALLVKTALFVPLLALGWLNRSLLIRFFARLRRSALVEAVLIGGIVVGVAVLTELRPGTEAPARAAAPPVGAKPPPLPPANAVVDARALGTTAVGLARVPGAATVTLLGPDGTGLDGRSVAIDGTEASRCGPGCYRGPTASAGPVRVVVNGRALRFDVPERAPAAAKLVRALTRRYRSSRTIVFDETLSSGVGNATVTRFTAVAPDRLAYRIRGGPSAIVVGTKRWDRDSATNPWQASGQTPIAVTEPYWSDPVNAHLVAPNVVTFLDRRIPAWFRVTFRSGRPTVSRMTAAAHFMVDRYVGFDVPAGVSPPPASR